MSRVLASSRATERSKSTRPTYGRSNHVPCRRRTTVDRRFQEGKDPLPSCWKGRTKRVAGGCDSVRAGLLRAAPRSCRPESIDPLWDEWASWYSTGWDIHRSPRSCHYPGHLRLPEKSWVGRSSVSREGHPRAFCTVPTHGDRGAGRQQRGDDSPKRRWGDAHASHLARHPDI